MWWTAGLEAEEQVRFLMFEKSTGKGGKES